MYDWDFGVIWNYRWLFAQGTMITVLLTLAVIVLGLLAGLVAGLAQLSKWRILRSISWFYIEVFRCTPLLVQLLWVYYALPMLVGIEMSATTAAILTLSLYGGSFYAEVIRGGIISIDSGQSEAGQALGMRPIQVMRRIVLPQALKRMIPPLMNQSIIQFKNTSLVSVLTVPDLLYMGQVAATETYRPLEIYTTIAVIYFVVLVPMTAVVKRAENKLAKGD